MGQRRNFKDRCREEPRAFEFSLSTYKTLRSIHKSTQGLIEHAQHLCT